MLIRLCSVRKEMKEITVRRKDAPPPPYMWGAPPADAKHPGLERLRTFLLSEQAFKTEPLPEMPGDVLYEID